MTNSVTLDNPIANKNKEIIATSSPLPNTRESPTSNSGSWKVLTSMLRIHIDFPRQRSVNMMEEYEDYLEANDLVDEKDVRRRQNLQQISNEDQDMDSANEEESKDGNEDQVPLPAPPSFGINFMAKPKNHGYYNVLKGMITRMELDGTLGKQREYGRKTQGKKLNEGKDEEYYYNLDDDFIDDQELNNNESNLKDFSQHEVINNNDQDEEFEFLPGDQIHNYSEIVKERKK